MALEPGPGRVPYHVVPVGGDGGLPRLVCCHSASGQRFHSVSLGETAALPSGCSCSGPGGPLSSPRGPQQGSGPSAEIPAAWAGVSAWLWAPGPGHSVSSGRFAARGTIWRACRPGVGLRAPLKPVCVRGHLGWPPARSVCQLQCAGAGCLSVRGECGPVTRRCAGSSVPLAELPQEPGP